MKNYMLEHNIVLQNMLKLHVIVITIRKQTKLIIN